MNNNHLSSLPYELGRLYQLDYLGTDPITIPHHPCAHPFAPDIRSNPLVEPFNLYVTDTDKLLSYLLDNAPSTRIKPSDAQRRLDLWCMVQSRKRHPFANGFTPWPLTLTTTQSPMVVRA